MKSAFIRGTQVKVYEDPVTQKKFEHWRVRFIDELIKIHDDGKGSSTTTNMLDMLRVEITKRESEEDN